MLVRALLFILLLALLAGAQTLDDAVRVLAKKIAARLAPGEIPRVAERSLVPAAASDAPRARALLERSLRRPAPRNATPVDIALTVSENLHGRLLVAEIRRAAEVAVEMAAYTTSASAAVSRPALDKRLVWEQDEQILDLALVEEQLLVLGTARIAWYARVQGRWEASDSKPVPVPIVRDARGRLEITGDSLAIHVPGAGCSGTWKPVLEVSCTQQQSEFLLQGQRVRFSNGRNTLEAESAEPFFSIARAGDVQIIGRQGAGAFEGWGSDFVGIDNACGSGARILAAGSGDRESADAVTAYEIAAGKPVAASDAAQLPGPVTALWPMPGGALAIARSLATGRYAAYSLTLDCGR